MALPNTTLTGLVAAATVAALAAGCGGSRQGSANDDPNADVTITFWHGWSAPSEVKAIQANIDAFEGAHPNIHVKVVGNITQLPVISQVTDAAGNIVKRARDAATNAIVQYTLSKAGKLLAASIVQARVRRNA